MKKSVLLLFGIILIIGGLTMSGIGMYGINHTSFPLTEITEKMVKSLAVISMGASFFSAGLILWIISLALKE